MLKLHDCHEMIAKFAELWQIRLFQVTIQVCLDRGRPVRKGRRDVCDPA
jgi:hypothetical protein